MRCDVCKENKDQIVLIHDAHGRRAVCQDCVRTVVPSTAEKTPAPVPTDEKSPASE